MRLREQRLWDSFSNNIGAGTWLQRMENAVGVGTPDVHAICNGQVSWIELKAVDGFPVRESTPVLGGKGLTVEQRNWHNDWFRNGGTSFILVGVGTGNKRELFLLPGLEADQVNGMNAKQLRKFKTDWLQINGMIAQARSQR